VSLGFIQAVYSVWHKGKAGKNIKMPITSYDTGSVDGGFVALRQGIIYSTKLSFYSKYRISQTGGTEVPSTLVWGTLSEQQRGAAVGMDMSESVAKTLP